MRSTNPARSQSAMLTATLAIALGGPAVSAQDAQPLEASSNHHSYSAEHSYSADSRISQGHRSLGDIRTYHQHYGYLYSTQTRDEPGWSTGWRVGASVEHFAFDVPNRTPLPARLGSVALRVGVNQRLSDRWSTSLEAQPGIYSDFEDISGDDLKPFGCSLDSGPAKANHTI